MKSKNVLKLAALMLGVAFFILLISHGLREETTPAKKYRPQAEVLKVPEKKTELIAKKVSIVKKKIVPKKQKDSTPAEFKKQYKRYQAFADLLIREDKKCAAGVEKLIPGEDFIDHADDMYKDYNKIIDITALLNQYVYRPVAVEAYKAAEEIAFMREFENSEIDVLEFYSSMANVNTCRDPKVLNYLITALEAAKKFNWPDSAKRRLVRNVLMTLYHDLASIPTALNLSFGMHGLNSLLELGYISSSYRGEIEFLVSETMEHQVTIMERLQPGGSRRNSIQELLFDFEVRKNAASKLSDILFKIQNEDYGN